MEIRFWRSRSFSRTGSSSDFPQEKPPDKMAFPHPQSRQQHDGKKHKARDRSIVRKDMKRAVNIAEDRNGEDDMDPEHDHSLGCVLHDHHSGRASSCSSRPKKWAQPYLAPW